MENVISLSKVKTADEMVIMDIQADDDHKSRLHSIGFVPGTVVSFVTKMAFGGPMAFQVRGGRSPATTPGLLP